MRQTGLETMGRLISSTLRLSRRWSAPTAAGFTHAPGQGCSWPLEHFPELARGAFGPPPTDWQSFAIEIGSQAGKGNHVLSKNDPERSPPVKEGAALGSFMDEPNPA